MNESREHLFLAAVERGDLTEDLFVTVDIPCPADVIDNAEYALTNQPTRVVQYVGQEPLSMMQVVLAEGAVPGMVAHVERRWVRSDEVDPTYVADLEARMTADLRRQAVAAGVDPETFDTVSSAARQHYIDTGEYLRVDKAGDTLDTLDADGTAWHYEGNGGYL